MSQSEDAPGDTDAMPGPSKSGGPSKEEVETDKERVRAMLRNISARYSPIAGRGEDPLAGMDDADLAAIERLSERGLLDDTYLPVEQAEEDSGQQSFPFIGEDLEIAARHSAAHYPTLFARLPLFAATSDRRVNDTKEFEHGQVVETSWGTIRRFGPGLNVYDEDTLIAVIRLAQQRKVSGRHTELPITINNRGPGLVLREETVTVHAGITNAHSINGYLGRGLGGSDLRHCRDSLRRLSLTLIELVKDSQNKQGVSDAGYEGRFQLFRFRGTHDFRGPVLIQFDPEMLALLSQYTRINMDVRRELSDIGKAVHKYFSSQLSRQHPTTSIRLSKLKQIAGYRSSLSDLKRALGTQLELMMRLGFLTQYSYTGTGRATPQVLRVWYDKTHGSKGSVY